MLKVKKLKCPALFSLTQHLSLYSMSTGILSRECEVDHESIQRRGKGWSETSSPPAVCLHGMDRDNFNLYLRSNPIQGVPKS